MRTFAQPVREVKYVRGALLVRLELSHCKGNGLVGYSPLQFAKTVVKCATLPCSGELVPSVAPPSRILKFGVFEVDRETSELRKSGMRVKLVGQPFQVLLLLLEHPQQVVTREALKQRIWPQDTHVDYDLALKRVMNRIREVLGDSAESPRFIETIPRVGYRFIAPVEAVRSSTGANARSVLSTTGSVIPWGLVDRYKWFVAGTILALTLLIAGLAPPGRRFFGHRGLATSNAALTGSPAASRGSPVPLVYQPLVLVAGPGKSAFTLTANGTGFTRNSAMNWNGKSLATIFVSSSQLKADVPASETAKAPTAAITVSSKNSGVVSNEVFVNFGRPAKAIKLTARQFYVGLDPDAVAVADFNRDGKLDLAVVNPGAATVCILLGNGDGTFQMPVHYAVEEGPFAQLVVGDFNGDGSLDLAVANYATNNVSVLLGNSDGTFRSAVNYKVGTNPSAIATADVNGDGNLDLVVTNQNCKERGANASGYRCVPGTISLMLGNGNGTFQDHKDFAAGVDLNGIAVGDFNGDGKLDLAVTGGNAGDAQAPAVSILLGNGDGTFQSPIGYGLDTNPNGIAVADFNGDGILDLAVVDNIGLVSVLLGKSDGTFQRRRDYIIGSFPEGNIGVGDFNGDGKLDLAIAESGANSIILMLGKGDGTFQALNKGDGYLKVPGPRFETATSPQGVAVGDFNGDGKLDFAVPARSSNMVTVLLQ